MLIWRPTIHSPPPTPAACVSFVRILLKCYLQTECSKGEVLSCEVEVELNSADGRNIGFFQLFFKKYCFVTTLWWFIVPLNGSWYQMANAKNCKSSLSNPEFKIFL